MELKIKSKKLEGKFIYADILEHKNATTLVVFLSGFSGSKELPLFEHASAEFIKNGFSTLRLNFCGDEDDKQKYQKALELSEMSFPVYVAELKNVLDFVGKKYSTMVLVGHSFGAPVSIMFLNKYTKYASKTQLILWDPALLPYKKKLMDKAFKFDLLKKLYIEKGTKNPCIFRKTFYKELSEGGNTSEILRELHHKTCIIGAKKSFGKDTEEYFAKLRNKKSSVFAIIKGANHLFDGKRVQKELFEKTLNFLKKS